MPRRQKYTVRRNRRQGYTVKKLGKSGYSFFGEIFNFRGIITEGKVEKSFYGNKEDSTWERILFKRK